MLNNSFFSFFIFSIETQYSIRGSSRFTRVAETQVVQFIERTQSRTKSKRALNANSLSDSFACFSTYHLESIKKYAIIKRFYPFLSPNNAIEEKGIIGEFFKFFLFNNTNEKTDISGEFNPIFFLEIQIKRGLFFESFFFFSLGEYKRKERNYQGVSLSFLSDNSNKNLALAGNVFKVVSLPNTLMRELILILIKTPAELPPRWRVGKVRVRLFLESFSFEPLKIKEKQCCCVFLVFDKQYYNLNKTIVESIIQPFVHFLTRKCKSTLMMDEGRFGFACTRQALFSIKIIFYCLLNVMRGAFLGAKRIAEGRALLSLLENSLFEYFAQMLYFLSFRERGATLNLMKNKQ